MKLHFLGICGTFMGSLAQLAKALGHQVSGSDQGVYPPMSDQLSAAGIELISGFDPADIPADVELVVIGNAMSRGNPSVEYVLERNLPYCSGPQWLHDHVLGERWVCAVAGTHGKTSTSSMLAWILDYAGMAPGFLIGGVPGNFEVSARLGETPFFVIEADEYDTAFFDKRSKFVHYKPRTLVLNNLEFDHADIFADLAAIETQFHHLVRLVPASGKIIYPQSETALTRVLERGCWSDSEAFGDSSQLHGKPLQADGSAFELCLGSETKATVNWGLTGQHNINNACAAVMAAHHVGVSISTAAEALAQFRLPKRRMEALHRDACQIEVFDDFAHHPTAIETTLAGARAGLAEGERLIAVLEPRSNTMKMGVHKDSLVASAAAADQTLWLEAPNLGWTIEPQLDDSGRCYHDAETLYQALQALVQPGDRVVFMSNGGFSGLPHRFADWVNGNWENEGAQR